MTDLARRRKRRRRLAVVAGFAVLTVVLTVFASLWRQSVQQTRRAVSEANRAEASKLLTLGQMALGEERTEALAFAIAALDRADTPEARRLALEALWEGPPKTIVPDGKNAWGLAFSPDGRNLAVGYWGGSVRIYPRDGRDPAVVDGFEDGKGFVLFLGFSPDSGHLLGSAAAAGGEIKVWETESWNLVRAFHTIPRPGLDRNKIDIAYGAFEPDQDSVLTISFQPNMGNDPAVPGKLQGRWLVQRWPMGGQPVQLIGAVDGTMGPTAMPDFNRGLLAVGLEDELRLHHLQVVGGEPPRIVGRYPEVFSIDSTPAFNPDANRLAVADEKGNLYLWSLDGDTRTPERRFHAPGDAMWTAFSPDGNLLAHASRHSSGWLWDLRDPAGTAPLRFDRQARQMNQLTFSPDGRWLATSIEGVSVALWPLTHRYSRRLIGHEGGVWRGVFSPDSQTLYTIGREDETILSWTLEGGSGTEPEVLASSPELLLGQLALDPQLRWLLVSAGRAGAFWKIPLDGSAPSSFEPFPWHPQGFVFDPAGRYIASSDYRQANTPTMFLYDLELDERVEFEPPGKGNVSGWSFDPDGRLLVTRGGVLSRSDPLQGSAETLIADGVRRAFARPDGRRLLIIPIEGSRSLYDLEDGSYTDLSSVHQSGLIAFDSDTSIVVSGHSDGEIRVGPVHSDNPHLLLGHEGPIHRVHVSPDGRWILSMGVDGDLRLWPMPGFSKPPLHTLPHQELMVKLKSLTNLRAVPTGDSHTGYQIQPDFEAYRGWETVPEW